MPVPPEYLGQARQLRWDLARADDEADHIALDLALGPIRARLERHPHSLVPRDMLASAAAAWGRLSGLPGHLGSHCDVKYRRRPRFIALRASAGRFNRTDWGADRWGSDAADGLLVVLVSGKIGHGRLVVDTHILATTTLHTLARWFERKRRPILELFET